jgi:hypothetical protein
MTYAAATTFLQNLGTFGSGDPPTLRDLARSVSWLAERYSKESLSGSNGKYGVFEAAVFGWCPHLNAFVVYHLHPDIAQNSFSLRIDELIPDKDSEAIVLGSGRERLLNRIDLIRARNTSQDRDEVPRLAAEAIIREDTGDVGGSLSIGVATHRGYELLSWISPATQEGNQAIRTFNGIELNDETQRVGHYLIALDWRA